MATPHTKQYYIAATRKSDRKRMHYVGELSFSGERDAALYFDNLDQAFNELALIENSWAGPEFTLYTILISNR